MRVVAEYPLKDIATVFVARLADGEQIEFVESVQPPYPRERKEVLVISTMAGCPVGCGMCDAGGFYKRKLTDEEMLAQVAHVVRTRYGGQKVPAQMFKIQLARMGEPSLNDQVLRLLERLPVEFDAPGLLPSLSSVGPAGRERFFDRVLGIKERLYRGRFQLQFSIHTTDPGQRDKLIPLRKLSFRELGRIGERFVREGDRKVTLNFALSREARLDPDVLARHFDPEKFLVKITPVNPTYRARSHGLTTAVDPADVIPRLRDAGYEVILSIGEISENQLGSNCGQYVQRHSEAAAPLEEGYRLLAPVGTALETS